MFEQGIEVELYARSDCPDDVVRFPVQGARYSGTLPKLLLLRSRRTGRPLLVGASRWGSADMDPDADAVYASPATIAELERPDEPPSQERFYPATASTATWLDIAIHARGYWLATGAASVGILAGLAGAAVAFATSVIPLGFGLLLLVLACLAEALKGLNDVRDAKRLGRGG